MTRSELFCELLAALIARNPKLSDQLRPSLSREIATKKLDGIAGNTEPLIDLYGWHNGTEPIRSSSQGRHTMSYADLTVAPQEILIFLELDLMLSHFASWLTVAQTHKRISEAVGRYFPFLWDGGTSWLAVDLQEEHRERVLFVEFQSEAPIREAYRSFDEFLVDLIRANKEGTQLAFT
jgi:hypothetical protein